MKKLFTKSDANGIKQSLIASFIFLVLLEPIIQIGRNLSKGIIDALVDYFYWSCSNVSYASFMSYIIFLAFALYMIRDSITLYRDSFSSNNGKELRHTKDELETVERQGLDKIIETAIEIEKENKAIGGDFKNNFFFYDSTQYIALFIFIGIQVYAGSSTCSI